MRIMGTTIEDGFSGADRAVFDMLSSRNLLAGVAGSFLPPHWRGFFLAKNIHLSKRAWYRAWTDEMTKSPLAFRARTRCLDRYLRARLETFDAVLQMGGLFAPFCGSNPVPVMLFCDYTTKLAESHYPPWFGLSDRLASSWYGLETDLYQSASAIFTPSENTRRSLVDDYHVSTERVVVVGEGVHQTWEHPTKRFDEHTVLFVGIDFDRKGGPAVLKAFERVKATIPQARLLIVGPHHGPPQDGVEWLGYITDRDRIRRLFSEATVFTMPSVCEPFGLTLIEAMSHGLPVVGSTADAMPEIIENGVTGFLVPVGDADMLAERLIQLLSTPDMCVAFGKAGQLKVADKFLWSLVGTKVECGIRSVLQH